MNEMGTSGHLYDLDSGEHLRPALVVEASCWAMLRRSGVSFMLVADDRPSARDCGHEVAVEWKLDAPRFAGEE